MKSSRSLRAAGWILLGFVAGYLILARETAPGRSAEDPHRAGAEVENPRGLLEPEASSERNARTSLPGIDPRKGSAELSVRVECGPDGLPIAGAELRLLLAPAGARTTERHARTGIDGTAAFRELPHGTGVLSCSHASSRSVRLDPGSRSEVVLTTGSDSVRVEVVDDLDQPVGGATVLTTAGAVSEITFAVGVTDPGGTVEVPCTERTNGWCARAPDGAGSPIVFGEATGPVRLRLARGECRVEGRVVDPDGRGVQDAEIVAWFTTGLRFDASGVGTACDWPTARARTDVEGRFRCAGPPGASVRLTAEAAAFAKRELRLDPPHPDVIEIRLESPASLVAVVSEPDGAPVPGAHVFVRGAASGRPLVEGSTDSDGRCRLSGLAAGEQSVEVVAKSGWRAARDARLHAGENGEIEFEVPGGVDVDVFVVGPDGEPPRGLLSAVFRGRATVDDTSRRRLLDARGRARFESTPPGTYDLQLVGNESQPTASEREVRVGSEPTEVRLEWASKAPEGRIRGSCVTADGAPIGDVRVTLVDTVHHGVGHRDTSGEGAFEFLGVPAGSYRLLLAAPGWTPRSIPEIALTEGLALDVGPLVLRPSARLSVRTEVEVRVERGDLSEVRAIVVRSPLAPVLDLEPGTYVLASHGPGSAAEVRELELEPGTHTRVEIAPRPGITVSLRFDAGAARGPNHSLRWAVHDAEGRVLLHGLAQTGARGQAGASVSLAPGTYVVVARIEGELDASTVEFEVVDGPVLRVPVTLR